MGEAGVASWSVKQIYNDAKTYEFEGFCVQMSLLFIMECRENLSGTSSQEKDQISNGKMIWQLKLSAYLYMPVCWQGCALLWHARADIYT